MAGDRLRVPMEDAYATSLGRATYVFATLEWNVVWCCERMNRGYIRKLKKKTAGAIAAAFITFASRYPNEKAKDELLAAGKEFKRLVERRNALLHAKPGTAKDGGQRLFGKITPWTIATIDAVADEFAVCSRAFNGFLYGELKAKATPESSP